MKQLDILTEVSRLFPEGTRTFPEIDHDGQDAKSGANEHLVADPWPAAPDYPPDLFAAAAHLLEVAGAYNYLVPNDVPGNWPQGAAFIAPDDLKRWIATGKAWARSVSTPKEVTQLWTDLGRHASAAIYQEHRPDSGAAPWWITLLAMLVIADEACEDLGYGSGPDLGDTGSKRSSWIFNAWFSPLALTYDKLLRQATSAGKNHITFFPQSSTVCQKIDPDVVCVQPKSRTPAVGCTVRTLSHNLAILPPRGVVRACWQRPPETPAPDDASPMNLLLIPYPFQVPAKLFKGDLRLSPSEINSGGVTDTKPWGWFEVDQAWLNGGPDLGATKREVERGKRRRALIAFTKRLIEQSLNDVGHLHGVVFPEYALDWDAYEELSNSLSAAFPSLEFLVAGSSSNCKGEQTNTALSSVFVRGGTAPSAGGDYTISTSRAKHHRWKLDEGQISTYALASALDPRVVWWEKTTLPKRDVHVNVFREGSTFATMICEDLARVDPCHTVLRSVAPSLVFVLLMDGPQLTTRWPARYATVLADDPGSSVLTFTSLALIERSNRTGRRDASRAVALWKEDTGRTEEIVCPQASHGIVLTLSGSRTTELTFDGRRNADGRAWRFHGQQPVSYVPSNKSEQRILELVTTSG